jgi:hypothetical protein
MSIVYPKVAARVLYRSILNISTRKSRALANGANIEISKASLAYQRRYK